MLAGVAGVLAVVAAGLAAYLASSPGQLSGLDRSLQQLDLLYLDEPAPLLGDLGIASGSPALIVVCEGCAAPAVDAQVRVTADRQVAHAYALVGPDGAAGPGYAVVDSRGQVRYRTFDPGLSRHGEEIRVLLKAVR